MSSGRISEDRFKELCGQARWLLSDAERKLGAVFDDDNNDLSVQMVAGEAANGLNVLMLVLALVEGLGEWAIRMDAWRDAIESLIQKADLDDSERQDILDRLGNLEYATVAEGQVERLKERLTGDLADMMAGRLRGEDGS